MRGCISSAQNKSWFLLQSCNVRNGHIIQWTAGQNPLGNASLSLRCTALMAQQWNLQRQMLDPRGVLEQLFSSRWAPSWHSFMIYESAQFLAWAWSAQCHTEHLWQQRTVCKVKCCRKAKEKSSLVDYILKARAYCNSAFPSRTCHRERHKVCLHTQHLLLT